MFKELLFNDKVRSKILKGVNIVADAVCSTLWPRGTHVIFEESEYWIPTVTKDGVTVAQHVVLEDKFENMWVSLAKEAAEKTNRNAGDGTTSTVAILREIVNEGNKYITAGMNPILIKRGMDEALKMVLEKLETFTKKIDSREERLNIATISANNDNELWDLIVSVIDEVGKDGVITVWTTNWMTTEVEYVNGSKLDGWFESPYFINDTKRLTATLENPTIIITSDRITMQSQLVPIIQDLLSNNKREMILFAEWVEDQALAFLIQNYLQGKFTCIPVKFPSFGWYQVDIMNDMAKLVGATVLGEEQGRKITEGKYEDCWTTEKIIVGRDYSIISWATGDVKDRIEEVRSLLESEKDSFKIEKLKERMGKLTGKIASIKIGWASETEQSEIRYRIEDAINATKSAIDSGIVEWAGTALLRCSNIVAPEWLSKESEAWFNIVKMAIKAPFKKIIQNGWENADAIMWEVLSWTEWFNSLTMKKENLFDAGVIDPHKVVLNEVTNAVATAGILLTSTVAIVNWDTK